MSLSKKTQKYLRTDIKYIIENGLFLSLGQVVTSIVTLGLAVAFAHFLSPEVYGTYKYTISIFSLFLIFTLPGMSQAVARASAKNIDILKKATFLRIKFSLLGSLIALAGGIYYFLQGNINLSIALLLVALFTPVFETFNLYLSYLAGKKNFYTQTKYQIITRIFSASILFCTIYFTDNIIIILISYFLPQSLAHLYFFLIVSQQEKGVENWLGVKETIAYGKHLTAMNVLGVVSANIDKILLWKFLGPTELAVYAFAIALPVEIKGVIKNIGTLAFPKFAQRNIKHIKESLPRKMFLFFLFLVFVTVIYIIVSPYLFKFLFSKYTDSILYSQIYSLSILFLPGVLLSSLFSAQMRIKELYVMNVVNSIILIALYIILIPLLGIVGAIITVLVTNVVSIILWLFLLYKKGSTC